MAYQIKGYKYYTKKELDQAFKDNFIIKLEQNNWTDKVAKWYLLRLETEMRSSSGNARLPARKNSHVQYKRYCPIFSIEFNWCEATNCCRGYRKFGAFEYETFPYAYNLGIGRIQDFDFLEEAIPSLLKHFKYEYIEKDILVTAYVSGDGSSAKISFPCSFFAKPGEYLKKIHNSLKELCAEKGIEVNLIKKYDNGRYSWWFEYVIDVEIV